VNRFFLNSLSLGMAIFISWSANAQDTQKFWNHDDRDCLRVLSEGKVLQNSVIPNNNNNYLEDRVILIAADNRLYDVSLYFKKGNTVSIYCSVTR